MSDPPPPSHLPDASNPLSHPDQASAAPVNVDGHATEAPSIPIATVDDLSAASASASGAGAPTATGAPVPVGTPVHFVADDNRGAAPTVIPVPGAPAGGIQVVAPSSFLRRPTPVRVQQPGELQRPSSASGSAPSSIPSIPNAVVGSPAAKRMEPIRPLSMVDREQIEGLRAIRAFLKVRTSYDVLPLSFRLIVLDTALLVKKSLNILIQNGIVSAPLWDSKTSTFAGLLTTTDYLNVIQYYWQNQDQLHEIDQFTLNSLREIEKAIGAPPIETVSIHPERPLYEACRMMAASRARRIPLVDIDDETKRSMVVSVVTQYRILKFVAVNVRETQKLKKPLKELETVGTYKDLATATMETPVMDVIHMLVNKNISSVPILDRDGAVINVFEAVDVIALIKGGVYDDLQLSVGEALLKRNDDFAGIYTCSVWDRLDTIFDTIRKSRVHRLVVIDENARLVGILTLSDILEYVLLHGADQEDRPIE